MQTLEADPFGGMTSKMHKFCELSFSGLSNAEAYRRAYDASGMTEKSVWTAAKEVAGNPRVTSRLRDLVAKREEQSTLVSSLSRDWITNGIMQLASHSDKDSVRLAAYIALGKTVGIDMFRETTRTEKVVRTPEEADAELKRLLNDMMTTVEGTATRLNAPAATSRAKPAPTNDPPRDRRRKPKPA